LNGLNISIVNKNQFVGDFRLDAETYQKIFIDIERQIQTVTHTSLEDEVSLFIKGIFDIKADCYVDKGIPFVRISNLKNMVISKNDIIYIPEEENEKNKKTFLRKNDIILSKTAYSAASLVTLDDGCNCSYS